MRILMVKGSPHKNGSSNMLADEFSRGATEAGHEVVEIDVAHAKVGPCRGCDYCGMNGPCVQSDDMAEMIDEILASDMMVMVTPIYYFGMSAQMKAFVDRWYSSTTRISGKHFKTALITAAWDSDADVMPAMVAHYGKLCRCMNFTDCGQVLGLGCGTPSMTSKSRFMKAAYELGRSL